MDGAKLIEIDLDTAGGRAAVVLGIHGRRVVVSAQSTSPAQPTLLAEDQFVSLLAQLAALPDDQTAASVQLLQQALELVAAAATCEDFTHATRPRRKMHDTSPAHDDDTLHAALYPATRFFVLHTPAPTAAGLSRLDRDTSPAASHLGAADTALPSDDPGASLDGSYPEFTADPALPRYSTRNVVVLQQYADEDLYGGGAGAGSAFRVLVGPGARHQHQNGGHGNRTGTRVAVCKASGAGLVDRELREELVRLQQVERMRVDQATAAPVTVRVPRLEGYVVHAVTGHIVGFLHSWITGATLQARLEEMDRRDAHFASAVAAAAAAAGRGKKGEKNGNKNHPAGLEEREKSREEELRARWAAQIRETVGTLHKMGVACGGADPENIIIDEHENAWVIDLGGDDGAPGQWVGAAAADSAFEADDEAVRKMAEEVLRAVDKVKIA